MMLPFRVVVSLFLKDGSFSKSCVSRCRVFWLFLLVFVAGCTTGTSTDLQQYNRASDEALLTVYFEAQGFCSSQKPLVLNNFILHSGQEQTRLFLEPVTIECEEAQGRQTLLGLASVPAGYYDQLSVTFTTVTVDGNNAVTQDLTLRFPKKVVLEGGDSTCLFMAWHLDEPVNSSAPITPKLSVRGQSQPLSRNLLYALCDELNTLYIVRTDTRFVIAAIGIDGAAGEIEIDPVRQRLYLVNRSRRSLQVFDLSTQSLVDRISLPLTLEPTHLALDIEHSVAFVSDPKSRRVLRIELDDGQLTGNQQVGLKPGRLIYIPQDGGGLVAICAPPSQNVHLLSSETLVMQRSLATGLRPRHLLSAAGRLYVSEEGSQSVAIFSLISGQQVGQVRMTGAPGELLATPLGDKAYVSNARTNSLSVLSPGQFTSLRSFSAGPGPGALAMSDRRGQIYVANPIAHSVTVLDRAAERIVSTIPLAGNVSDIAVFE